MANDLATLRTRLAVSLRDPLMQTWESSELDDLLNQACASMYPRVALPMASPIYPIVTADQEDFDMPIGMLEISRVDLADVNTDLLIMPLPPGTWEIYGDVFSGTAKLFVNRLYIDESYYLIAHGYGTYNLSTGTPPDHYVPYILAHAQAEALRTMVSERARFEKWSTRNQKQNISVNELSQMLNQAEAKAERELSRMKTWRKPKPAR